MLVYWGLIFMAPSQAKKGSWVGDLDEKPRLILTRSHLYHPSLERSHPYHPHSPQDQIQRHFRARGALRIDRVL
jgi:hypothetical protein